MKPLLMNEIRDKSVAELKGLVEELSQARFKLRMNSNADDVVKTHHFKSIRKNIARVKTFLAEEAAK